MRRITRVYENEPLPDSHRIEQILQTEEVPTGVGTNTRRVYVVVLIDERFWMTDEQKEDDLRAVGLLP